MHESFVTVPFGARWLRRDLHTLGCTANVAAALMTAPLKRIGLPTSLMSRGADAGLRADFPMVRPDLRSSLVGLATETLPVLPRLCSGCCFDCV